MATSTFGYKRLEKLCIPDLNAAGIPELMLNKV